MVAARAPHPPVDRPDLIESLLHGGRLGRRRGAGLELDSLGPYQLGDDVRHIDWLASARSGRTQVKRFRIEHQLTVMLVIDLRSSMFFGTQSFLMAKTACLAAARIAHTLSHHHQPLGWVLLVNETPSVLVPERGRSARLRQYQTVVETYQRTLKTQDAGASVSLGEALGNLHEALRNVSLMILISDFSFLGEQLEDSLKALEPRRAAVVVIEDEMFLNPLPHGSYPIEVIPGGERFWSVIGHQDADSVAAQLEAFQQELDNRLLSLGVRPILRCDPLSLQRGVWR